MSKYDKNYGYNPDQAPLVKGEKLLIETKPKKSAFIINKSLTMLPFALLWGCFDGFFISTFISHEESTKMLWFLIPFFAFHLMPVWIWLANVLTANRKWKNTKYYITDKRIIIQNGLISENYQTIYYKEIKNVSLHVGVFDKLLGVGDIKIDTGSVRRGEDISFLGGSFLDIEDYREVYDRLQKTVLDIQTDIEYPNALRPETNPGYNTEYNPDEEQ